MSPLAFAWRSLSREPARALLCVAGIAIVGALLLDMLLLSRGLILSFGEILESTGYDVRVTATQALPGMGPPVLEAGRALATLRALPELEEVGALRFELASVRSRDGALKEVTLIAGGPRQRGEWTVERGRDLSEPTPDGVPEAVVNEELAQQLGLAPGSLFELQPGRPGSGSALPPGRFRVAGIGSFPFDMTGERTCAVTLSAFRAAQLGSDRDEADILLVASRSSFGSQAAVQAIRRARPDLHAFSTEDLLARFGRADFSYFRQISFALSAITSGFAFLLVTTLLTVSVNQRLAEVAALRALGFTRRRISLDLLAESALLVGSGGLLAVPLGLGLSRVLDSILREMPGIPARLHFFVLEPRAVALHLSLLTLTTLLAAAYPIALTARLPIADTLRRELVS